MERKHGFGMVVENIHPQPDYSQTDEIPHRDLFTTVRLADVLSNQLRFEAAAYSVALRKALKQIGESGTSVCPILGEDALGDSATNAFRFKRHYVDKEHGVPFLSSSSIIELRPKPDKFLSRKITKNIDDLLIDHHDILISCSGTIGNVALAGTTIAGMALSQHAIKLKTMDAITAGYIAAFLRSSYGKIQLTQSSYGSVVTHIEPHHLETVYAPNPHPIVKSNIGNLMLEATKLRDESNRLLDEADNLVHEILNLRPLDELNQDNEVVLHSSVRASQLQWRFEASYHNPIIKNISHALEQSQYTITTLDDEKLTREVRPITKFRKRVYVKEGGIPLLNSKQLFQIDPVERKAIAKGAHTKDLPEIGLEENMLAITCSGTIGRVQIIPAYMEGWAASQDAIRVIAQDPETAGFLYAWLASDYGQKLLLRETYGSVVVHIDSTMLSTVQVPDVDEHIRNHIGSIVIRANKLRDEAWQKEQQAIHQVESLIRNSH